MREEIRIDRIMEKISEYWHAHPDQRLWQILMNANTHLYSDDISQKYNMKDPYYIEDDELESRLDENFKMGEQK